MIERDEITRMRACAHLLEPPGQEVVSQLADELLEALARAEKAEVDLAAEKARWVELRAWRRKWISPVNSEASMVLDYLDHDILDRLSSPAESVAVTVEAHDASRMIPSALVTDDGVTVLCLTPEGRERLTVAQGTRLLITKIGGEP